MRKRESGQVESLLDYAEQTAGRIMNPNVFALGEDLTVAEAVSALQNAVNVEMVFYLYVVDGRRHLVGVTSLRRLLLVAPETPLKRIMTPDVFSVRVDTDQEEAARLVASYNRRHHGRRRHRCAQGRGDRRPLPPGRRLRR
jgi:magnesium transporter